MPDRNGNITVEELVEMLVAVLGAHYGTTVHDIGNGDGLSAAQAAKIQGFWRDYLSARSTVKDVMSRLEA